MFERFPRLILKENRKAHSMEEALFWIKLAKERGKAALFGLYSFREWKDGKPVYESVTLDVIGLIGKQEKLQELALKFLEEGKQSLLIFDGKDYLLFVEHDESPLEKVKEPPETSLIKDLFFKFTYPNTRNAVTGELSRIMRRFKIE